MSVRLLFLLWIGLLLTPLVHAQPRYAYTDIAVDIPFDGGGTLMVSRMWAWNEHLHFGIVGGGGVIEREFEITRPGLSPLDATTKATLLPFIGPRVSLFYHVVGISLSYGVYQARTNFDVHGVTPALSSKKSAWGTGAYSPLITIDFYSRKHDVVFGFGLGGFYGSSYPDLVADNGSLRVTSRDDPINTLTFHVHTFWTDGRRSRMKKRDVFD